MEIIVGKTAGFCYGVKRAVEGTKKKLEQGKEVYCLGELVHNEQVIQELEGKGLQIIDDLEQTGGITIIRAHGVTKETYEKAKQEETILKDYTCPHVLKIHKIAEEYARKRRCYSFMWK